MKFTARLNKRDSPYVIVDEVFELNEGKSEGYLAHDNVNQKTVEIFTAPLRQGEKILTYTAESKVDTPWKTYLIVFADAEKVYVNYETKGDTVEADDVNELQQAAINLDADLKHQQEILQGHLDDGQNPHRTTKAQVGLEHADDTSDLDKPVSTAQAAAMKIVGDDINAHRTEQNNPHQVTKAQVGLGSVDDVKQASKSEFDAHNTDEIRHLTAQERASWNDKYTRTEVDNKFSANAIPKATSAVDGLFAKEDKAKLDGVAAGANHYVHPANHPASMITGLSKVATSGNYDDLANKPNSGLPPSGVTWNQLKGV